MKTNKNKNGIQIILVCIFFISVIASSIVYDTQIDTAYEIDSAQSIIDNKIPTGSTIGDLIDYPEDELDVAYTTDFVLYFNNENGIEENIEDIEIYIFASAEYPILGNPMETLITPITNYGTILPSFAVDEITI